MSAMPDPTPLPVAPVVRPVRPTPDEAYALMVAGNARFAAGTPARPNQDDARRVQLVAGQEPFAAVLGCADSRVPAEIVFDQGLGDLFVCRTAGPIVDFAVLGSIEFAIAYLHVPLVVVMGHESCGALKAAAETASGTLEPGGSVRDLVEKVLPITLQAQREGGTKDEQLSRAIGYNVTRVINLLIERSPVIADAVADGSVKLVGAVYELDGGRARFL
ncbi:carbonic anhydrase [Cryptosporangium aurantiacum]|uniref:Carbonic anhydrase n=2 Tax=Cryptosporangium aurantiacum TaxID=134849 RepID=A0A1M7RHH6_9ACTN|nr:carbonic anhydrase [Cryptosporangium aurantiacum]